MWEGSCEGAGERYHACGDGTSHVPAVCCIERRAFAGRQVRAGTEAVVYRLAEVITILELMLPQNDDGVRPVARVSD